MSEFVASPILEVRGLTVGYGKAGPAVADVDLDITAGELVAVLGANGAGKTTLMQSIAGLVPLRAGTVTFGGRDLTRTAAHVRARLGIGLSLEGHQVVDRLSVEDNLLLAVGAQRRRLGVAGVEARLAEAYTMFPVLGERTHALAGSLSGGQQQMLVLGRLLAADSTLLLLDEPSLGLSPAIVESVYECLDLLRARGKAIVVVEQTAALATQMCDRALLLRRGRLVHPGNGVSFTEDEFREAYLAS